MTPASGAQLGNIHPFHNEKTWCQTQLIDANTRPEIKGLLSSSTWTQPVINTNIKVEIFPIYTYNIHIYNIYYIYIIDIHRYCTSHIIFSIIILLITHRLHLRRGQTSAAKVHQDIWCKDDTMEVPCPTSVRDDLPGTGELDKCGWMWLVCPDKLL